MTQFLNRSLQSALLLVSIPLCIDPAYAQTGICPAQLEAEIAAVTQTGEFARAHWGILVETEDGQQTLYAEDAERYFVPASNAKLFTTAAALQQLGADFQVRTSVMQINPEAGEVVLQVVGRGDPSLTDADLADLAQQLRDRGITEIDLLIGDDSYFQGEAVNPTWEWGDLQAGYGAPANSLILNQNAIGFTLVPQTLGQPLEVVWDDPAEAGQWQVNNDSTTVAAGAPEFVSVGRDLNQPILEVQGQLQAGSASEPVSVSIPRPAQYFMQRLLQALNAQGIQVKQSLISLTPIDEQGTEIAFVESLPLADLLVETNQESNNLYAEALLRSLGVTESTNATSALIAGIDTLQRNLTELGIDRADYELVDGSGLSRQNLVSPEAIVQTLQAMNRSSNALPYRNSLSVAAESGTLQNRFQGTAVAGRLQGKTGALSGVVALSGYLEPINYLPLTFSILLNNANLSLGEAQAAIDQIVKLLARLQRC